MMKMIRSLLLAGALARSVKQAKIAILGRALPLLNNPLMVAEEYAILDNLTRGRFIAGFVRGPGLQEPVGPQHAADLVRVIVGLALTHRCLLGLSGSASGRAFRPTPHR